VSGHVSCRGELDAKADRHAFANLDRWSGSSMVANALEVNTAALASFGVRRLVAAFWEPPGKSAGGSSREVWPSPRVRKRRESADPSPPEGCSRARAP
jgi:hypothetical protein